MSSSAIQTTATALSFVDFFLLGAVFVYFNRRLNALEKGSPLIASSSDNCKPESAEQRILALENNIEVLLERLNCYDTLFSKIMSRMRDCMGGQHMVSVPSPITASPKRTSLRSRTNESVIARKEPFVDANSSTDSEVEFDNYSFLE